MSKVDAQINALVQNAHDDGAEPNTAVTPEDGLEDDALHGMIVVYAGMGGGSTPLIGIKQGDDVLGAAPLGTVEPVRFAVQLKYEAKGLVLLWGTRYTHHWVNPLVKKL